MLNSVQCQGFKSGNFFNHYPNPAKLSEEDQIVSTLRAEKENNKDTQKGKERIENNWSEFQFSSHTIFIGQSSALFASLKMEVIPSAFIPRLTVGTSVSSQILSFAL
ncbi:hypothetical protein AVEN_142096-1 [Araneus ventricosus]|uniref:Uncharacterized protein n=1 Tax=Araneus ventricosus TaxID=182803 RepID=A0A4Y2HZ60_ARAVE|nr:hypothetical protein AVEN_142096-1 [Araneus ventricosus]